MGLAGVAVLRRPASSLCGVRALSGRDLARLRPVHRRSWSGGSSSVRAAASGRPPAPAAKAWPEAPAAKAWPEGDSRAGRGGATRPGRIPDGSGRGGGVRRQCGYHGPHRGPPTPHGRGPRWSRVGQVCWQAAVGRTGSWHRRGRAGGWRRRTGCRGAALGLRHALWWDGGPGCGHAGGAERVPPKERSPDQRGGADGRCARDTVRRKRVVVRRDGTVLGRVRACRRIALLGCCGLVRRLLHLRGLRLLLVEPEAEQRRQGEQSHLSSLRCEMGERTAAGICSPVRFGVQLLQTHRAANVRVMVSRLAVSTPHPTHLPKPSSPLSRHLPRYSRRFMTLMRPSIPALNLLALLYHPCPSYSSRSALLLPALGKHTFFTPISFASRSFSLECTLRSAATS